MLVLVFTDKPETADFTRQLIDKHRNNSELDIRKVASVSLALAILRQVGRQEREIRALFDLTSIEEAFQMVKNLFDAKNERKLSAEILSKVKMAIAINPEQEEEFFSRRRELNEWSSLVWTTLKLVESSIWFGGRGRVNNLESDQRGQERGRR
ncbi:MAG: hypothetical protein UW86_C0005G0012 [Microgenomates group bacterium GW2011_GWA1_Microgenomates_45_10]|nr:MAG: hypothetical protein UW69_C0005G0012 [Microgenomates group bacterium GW2011_GWA2_44_7]KKT87271.1 MAG: hypothetical protein UW86_C0005G0012 [Microgenomates group bacterium GW2011_GWA1_Microgenomates_45_10]